MPRYMDTYDQIVFQQGIEHLPQFRGYDRETREFGVWYVYFRNEGWVTWNEARVLYKKQMDLFLSEPEQEMLESV